MMPHLGVLASVHERSAMEVFEKDCLIVLGTCIAAAGEGKPGKPCFKYSIQGGATASGELMFGDLELVPLGVGETALVEVHPSRGFDLGNGPGRTVKKTVKGGTVGIVLDARGRALELPEDDEERRAYLQNIVRTTSLYEETALQGA